MNVNISSRIPATKCPHCARFLTGVSGPKAKPVPGDAIACIGCGAVCTVDDAGALCGFTEAQLAELAADPEVQLDMARMVRAIHQIHAEAN